MNHLKAEDFEKNLNTQFKILRAADEVFEAPLVEVLVLRRDEVLETFSIIFLLPFDFGYHQQLFNFEHAELGAMELFIVPVSQLETGIRYEAVFNRIVKK